MQMHILLVQPAGWSLPWLTAILREAGLDAYRLEHVGSLPRAIERLVDRGADLVLLDRATVEDGETALLRLQCIAPGTPVVPFVTVAGETLLDRELLIRCIVRIWRASQNRRRLVHRATHDRLTGLANRWLLEDKVAEAVARARRRGDPGALVFLDLDGFKAINDRYGHDAGDFVLKTIGERLRRVVRESDTVARFGGDEFVVLLEEVRNEKSAGKVAAKLERVIAEPVPLPHGPTVIRASTGLSLFPSQGTNLHDLLRRADRLMYHNKLNRRLDNAVA